MTEIIIICGPSGVGKTSLITKLLEEFREALGFSVSYTTRGIRRGETVGKDYIYISKEEFQQKEFYETCLFSDNHYGTAKNEVRRIQKIGKIPLLDVNVKSIKQLQGQKELICSLIIFIKPPNPIEKTLEERLKKRSKETGEDDIAIRKRLASAKIELEQCEKLNLHNIIINDDIEKAYKELREMIIPVILKLQRKNDGKVLGNETIGDRNDERGNRHTFDAIKDGITDDLRNLHIVDNDANSDLVTDNICTSKDNLNDFRNSIPSKGDKGNRI